MTNSRVTQGERGAAALSLLTVGMILALAIFVVMAVPLTKAGDAKAKSNSAADAAALAGVDFVRGELRNALATEGWLGGWDAYAGSIGTGLDAASSYANRNDATLTQYQFSAVNLESYAKVRGRSVDGRPAVSDATARLTLPACSTETEDPPEPDPDPDPGDPGDPGDEGDEPPPPPPPPAVTFRCAGIVVVINPTAEDPGKLPLPGSVIDALIDGSRAKLVS